VFPKVCPQHRSSSSCTSTQPWRSSTRRAEVPILTWMTTTSANRHVPTNSVKSSYTRLVLSSTSFKGPIERTKVFLPKPKMYLFLSSNNFKAQRFQSPGENRHRSLGILVDSNRRFHKNSVKLLMRRRRALTWMQSYRRVFSFQEKKRVNVSFVQSLMD